MVHAVQHVLEMQGRVHDGIQWLQATSVNWADTALSYHNWWHLALHHLELDDITSALDVYDRLLHPRSSAVALELVDASQLLWRIALRGGDVAARWQALAVCWAGPEEGGFYAFNDVHALIAYNAAGRDEHQRRMLVKLEECADGVHTNAKNTREIALPLARALASERTELKPASPFNWQLTARAQDALGDAAAAKTVREHAELRRRAQLRRSAA